MHISVPPAQIWVGPHNILIHKTQEFLHSLWCALPTCDNCLVDTQIKNKQHHGLLWLCPKSNYTLEMLEPLFNIIAFKRNSSDPFFYIFENADVLSTLCANRLLKLIEEPPCGYYFIFLASRKDTLLKTIQSRCVMQEFYSTVSLPYQSPLFKILIQEEPTHSFMTILDKAGITDQESSILAQQLLSYWSEQYMQAIKIEEQSPATVCRGHD